MVKCEPIVAAVDHSPIQGGAALLKAEVYMYSPMEIRPTIDNNEHVSERITIPNDLSFNQSSKVTFDN